MRTTVFTAYVSVSLGVLPNSACWLSFEVTSVCVCVCVTYALLITEHVFFSQQHRSNNGTRAFSVAGPTVWNSLPDCLRDPAVDSEQFRRDLKTYVFAGHSRR